LLCGDWHTAEDLVQSAPAKVFVAACPALGGPIPATTAVHAPVIRERAGSLGSHGNLPLRATFSPDGKILAVTGSADLREWSVTTDRQIGRTIHPGNYASNGVVFTLDGKTMITTDADQAIQEWSVATQREVGSFTNAGPKNHFSSEAISPDGKLLATTSYGGPARLWNLVG
jgi:WD40 repeat protein